MEYLRSDSINVYTDGSQKERPRRGGFGIVYVTDSGGDDFDVDNFARPGYEGASNQQMELWAVVQALRELGAKGWKPLDVEKFKRITFYLDSQYVIDGANAAERLRAQGWKNRDGKPISNSRLWEAYLEAKKKIKIPIYFEKVRGHSGNKYNDMADAQADLSRENRIGQYLPGAAIARRKFSSKQVKQGSIRPAGQIVLIHVITEYPEMGDANRFKIEVVDPESDDFEKVDFYYADQALKLRAHHAYMVQLNEDKKNPRIVAVIDEIAREDLFYADEDQEADEDEAADEDEQLEPAGL